MKNLILASLALAAFGTTTTPAHANANRDSSRQDVQPGNVVLAPDRSLQDWQQSVSEELSDRAQYPRAASAMVRDSDFVIVRFRCGSDGKPVDLTLSRKSPNSHFNSAALRAVAGIRSLHPLPGGLAEGRIIQANLVFATDDAALNHQYARLEQSERSRMANAREQENVIALNPQVRTPG